MFITDTRAEPSVELLLRDGAAATAVAALANLGIAAVAEGSGISLNVGAAPIMLPAFAILTAICSAVGLLIALVIRRFAAHPRPTWIFATTGLTVLSLIPDVTADAMVATRIVLAITHLVAAAIVIPAVARRLPA